jgi:RNA polymerase sigma-B factor
VKYPVVNQLIHFLSAFYEPGVQGVEIPVATSSPKEYARTMVAAAGDLLSAWCGNRDPEARRELIEQHLPLVRSLARRFASRGDQLEDLTQVGAVGLIKAVDRFDPGRGSSLAAYAVPTIVGEIRRHLRDTGQPVHVTRSDRAAGVVVRAVPLEGVVEPAAPAPGDERVLLERGLRALPRRQRRIVQLHYFDNVSQRGIASELGLSQVHVSRLLRESLGRMREAIGQT